MQKESDRIGTRVDESTFNDDNCYATDVHFRKFLVNLFSEIMMFSMKFST